MNKFGLVFFLLLSNPVLAVDKEEYIIPASTDLKKGRDIWLKNCEACHGYGIADAPIPMRPRDWIERVAKGQTLLYRHAIEGYISDDYSVMPARGGNEQLSDEHVKAAVDYMLFLANFYIKEKGGL